MKSTLQIQWNVPEDDSNAVIWYEISYPGQGHETGKTITKPNFIHVRTSPTLLTTYASADESLLNVCQSYTSSDHNVVRAVIYSKEGFDQRTLIKRDKEERMGRATCMYIVLTCGLILCLAPCCFPCCKSINPKLDEMALCQQVQERYRTSKNTDSIIDTCTFTTADVPLASEAILKE